jgi:hypothetical protein
VAPRNGPASAAVPAALPGPSAAISLPILLPVPAIKRARDIFFPEPRPFKSLPGRDPYASVFSIAPQLKERFNKREKLYGRFVVPVAKIKASLSHARARARTREREREREGALRLTTVLCCMDAGARSVQRGGHQADANPL